MKTALAEKEPFATEESLKNTESDVYIIDNALNFVNDLLRNMLDMHRAANKQLKVTLEPTDVLHDVLEPVQAMLNQRDGKVNVSISCPPNLFVMGDRLRLNQVMINLGRNSIKFVDEGFIKLAAEEVDGCVQFSVSDSGPGIPEEKKARLFQKYQESLDILSQGTVRPLKLFVMSPNWHKSLSQRRSFTSYNRILSSGNWSVLVQEPGGTNGRLYLFGRIVRQRDPWPERYSIPCHSQ